MKIYSLLQCSWVSDSNIPEENPDSQIKKIYYRERTRQLKSSFAGPVYLKNLSFFFSFIC